MYTRNEVARMQPDELIAALDDAEQCLLEMEKAKQNRNEFISEKNKLLGTRDDLEQNGTKVPRPITIAIIVALFLLFFMSDLPGWAQWIFLILVFVAVLFYKNRRRAYVEEQVKQIQSVDLPDVEARIAQSNQEVESLLPWLYEVQSLMTEEMTSLDCVRGIRAQLLRGAPNWFGALQAYQAELNEQARAKREEEHRRYLEEQARQMAANSAQAAKDAAAARKLAEQAKTSQNTKTSSGGCPRCGSPNIGIVQSYYDPNNKIWYEPYWKCSNCGHTWD